MLSPKEEEFVAGYAYVPEHLAGYGRVVSRGEPFLADDFLCYLEKSFLIFVGYPLNKDFHSRMMERAVEKAISRFRPARVALIAPSIPRKDREGENPDCYYRIDLSRWEIRPKVRNMVQRASQVVEAKKGVPFQKEHQQLIADFLARRQVHDGTRSIFERVPLYASSVPSVVLFEARDPAGKLIAYDLADFGAKDYAFYMFNFRSLRSHVPGTSDLLLYALIQEARDRGKSFVNLGLGVNAGVTFFKEKWGGLPFLPHQFLIYRPSSPSIFGSLLQGFLDDKRALE